MIHPKRFLHWYLQSWKRHLVKQFKIFICNPTNNSTDYTQQFIETLKSRYSGGIRTLRPEELNEADLVLLILTNNKQEQLFQAKQLTEIQQSLQNYKNIFVLLSHSLLELHQQELPHEISGITSFPQANSISGAIDRLEEYVFTQPQLSYRQNKGPKFRLVEMRPGYEYLIEEIYIHRLVTSPSTTATDKVAILQQFEADLKLEKIPHSCLVHIIPDWSNLPEKIRSEVFEHLTKRLSARSEYRRSAEDFVQELQTLPLSYYVFTSPRLFVKADAQQGKSIY